VSRCESERYTVDHASGTRRGVGEDAYARQSGSHPDPAPPAPLALGVDLVEVARIGNALRRHPVRFLTRHFTAVEREQCGADPARLAARWAAKEAAAKALGTGIGAVRWTDLEVVCDPRGTPRLRLHGHAGAKAEALRLAAWSVSLTHTAGHALAVVAALAAPDAE